MSNSRKAMPPPPPPPAPRNTKTRHKGSYVVELVTLLIVISIVPYFYQMYSSVQDANRQWSELRHISEGHALMVDAYLNCRGKVFSGTKSECQVTTLSYAKALNIDDSESILKSIAQTGRRADK